MITKKYLIGAGLGLLISLVCYLRPALSQSTTLVDIKQYAPNISLDIRYASTNNFMRTKLYNSPRCLLRPQVAQRLAQVEQDLNRIGVGLKLWDCYRPYSVQERMFRLVSNPSWVSDPSKGTVKHTRGAAVDLTIINLSTKREYPMPSGFDDFTEAAKRSYTRASQRQFNNSKTLEYYTARRGFLPYPGEWWHYDDPNWQSYKPLNAPL